jgi:protein Tex
MKLNDSAPSNTAARSQAGERVNNNGAKTSVNSSSQRQQTSSAPVGNTAFAEAFAKLKTKN